MAKIEEYIAKTRRIDPEDRGYTAAETAARRIGASARQEQQDFEGIARAHKDISTALGKQAEDARLSAGLQAQMIDEFKGIFEENNIGARATGGGGARVQEERRPRAGPQDPSSQVASGAYMLTNRLAQAAAKKSAPTVQTIYDNSWWDRHMQDSGYSRNSDGGWSYDGPGGVAPGKGTPASEFKPDPWDIPQASNGGYPIAPEPSTADHIVSTLGGWWKNTFGGGTSAAASQDAEAGVPASSGGSSSPSEETVSFGTGGSDANSTSENSSTSPSGNDFGSSGIGDQ